MIWLRKAVVHFLALILLLSLLGLAAATAFDRDFAHPAKLESWLSQSKIYDQVIPKALSSAQASSSQDGSEGSISLNDPGVQQAANQAFSPTFIGQSVNTFLEGNYAWLEGKSTVPSFKIDLTVPKQSFATAIGQLVQSHLTAIPACTDTQLTQLQLPVDPLSVSCRPPTLDPKTEGSQVAQDVSTGDFLNKPVISAATLTQNQSQPYYQKLSKVPGLFRLTLKLPYILTVVAVIAALAILAIASTRRKGLRRDGSVLLTAGVLLLLDKSITDQVVKKLESKTLTQTLGGQLKQPYHDVLNQITASFTQVELWFGTGFVVLAALIFAYLLLTREGAKDTVQTKIADSAVDEAEETDEPAQSVPPAKLPTSPDDIRLAPRRRPSADVMSTKPKPVPSKPVGLNTSTAPLINLKKPKPPKRPRLIQ